MGNQDLGVLNFLRNLRKSTYENNVLSAGALEQATRTINSVISFPTFAPFRHSLKNRKSFRKLECHPLHSPKSWEHLCKNMFRGFLSF